MDIQILAGRLHCRKGALPFQYLGLPIGARLRSLAFWDPVVDKFEKKLSTWKTKYLSFGGRITLIKSSFSNLLVNYMSFCRMLKVVIKKMDQILRNFL